MEIGDPWNIDLRDKVAVFILETLAVSFFYRAGHTDLGDRKV
jgi:hypothetical protein